MTELLYLRDAYLREFDATVLEVDVDGPAVVLDRTAFYPTGGGQPHDTGSLGGAPVVDVRKDGDRVLAHARRGTGAGRGCSGARCDRLGAPPPADAHALGDARAVRRDLERVASKAVTGGNMEPLDGRMDFEFDPLPEGFGAECEELVNAEIAADRPIEVSFLPATPRSPTTTSSAPR